MPRAKSTQAKKEAKEAGKSTSRVAKSSATSEDVVESKDAGAAQNTGHLIAPVSDADPEATITALLDVILLVVLVSAANSAWFRQFVPIHGMSAPQQSPTQFLTLDLLPMYTLFSAEFQPTLNVGSLGPFPEAPWIFLAVAFAQPIQFVLGSFLPAMAATILPALATRGAALVVRLAMLRIWAFYDEHHQTPPLLLRVVNVSLYVGLTIVWSQWASWDPLGKLLISAFPTALLPETWAAPFVVTVLAAGRSALRWRARTAIAKLVRASASRISLSIFIGIALLPIIHSLLLNTHSPLGFAKEQLEAALHDKGFTLVDRADGAGTGYVSVLHNDKDSYTILRSGHSLVGGTWDEGDGLVKEPIFAVFEMLEAVRLMKPKRGKRNAETNAQALSIGLGIGTAPTAFINHGINTTIVEVDRNIYDFAVKYFDLPFTHTAVIKDAVKWVASMSRPHVPHGIEVKTDEEFSRYPPAQQWDYILHDVFTGGVEPAALFTFEFLAALRRLLKDDGSIAINYAGSLQSNSTRVVIRTIFSVFRGQCRVYREDQNIGQDNESVDDLTNIVVFCRKDGGNFEFEQPSAADFLGTKSRKRFLLPKHETLDEAFTTGSLHADTSRLNFTDPGTLLFKSNIQHLQSLQQDPGKRHWELMRTVVPPQVWINY